MGGRHGYGDERPPGRFMGRYQDWEGGRGGYGDSSNRGSTQRSEFPHLMFFFGLVNVQTRKYE